MDKSIGWQKWLLLCIPALLVVALYAASLPSIGFISDDWDLLERVSNAPFYMPIENHHYNLLINFLFKLVALDIISPAGIHAAAVAGHLANTFLVFVIARKGFQTDFTFAWMLSLLFAVSPAGVEAIVWCCAIGYIASAFWIFLAIYLFTQQTKYNALWFVAIQLLAFASWDWGMLVFPCLFVMACCYQTLRSRKELLVSLVPVAVCWMTVLVLKKVFGFSMGYAVNTPIVFLKNILSAPLVTLLPQFSKNFYQSGAGIALALALLAILVVYSLRNRTALLMTLLFFVCQLPQAALGHPQSRYAYLAVFPLCFVVLMLCREKMKALFPVSVLVLAAVYCVWTAERVVLWKEGFAEMQKLRHHVQELAEGEKAIAIVNLPDRYGPEEMIWLPHGWRNGRNTFYPHIVFYTTADSSPALKIFGLPELTRQEIKEKHSKDPIYEVIQRKNASLWEYGLVSY